MKWNLWQVGLDQERDLRMNSSILIGQELRLSLLPGELSALAPGLVSMVEWITCHLIHQAATGLPLARCRTAVYIQDLLIELVLRRQ